MPSLPKTHAQPEEVQAGKLTGPAAD
uniref:Uncharacterized protein n=1 Tax=uncultured Acidimicrobiales bacterium TaxID=310071 RepID=A0A6J4JCT6_9ACTN|nr:MAG: hypothetical protein AVDCRST_MAG10-3630 [uncultured Acidimicrobiales bacterium]